MKSDLILAKTAKGLAAAQGGAGLSARAVAVLTAIDGRRDLESLRHRSGALTTQEVADAVHELMSSGYVQVIGEPSALSDEPAAQDDAALLLSLDFSALRTQKLNRTLEAATISEVLIAEEERRAIAVEQSGAASDPTRAAYAKLEAEMRGTLVKELRPRVEEALRVKLRPKIAEELRRALAAALRPRLEAAVRAQLEAELKPRIELELRARFARQIADMRTQLRNGTREAATLPPLLAEPEPCTPADDGTARLFACLSEVVFTTDATGVLTRVNAAWDQLSRHRETDSTGKPLSDFFVAEDRRGVDAFLRRVADGTAISYAHEAQLERSVGGTVWVELRAAPLALASGESAGVCGVIRETTEARRAAAELQDVGLELLLLVDEAEAGVLIEDAEGTIKQVNPAFCALFGVQAAPFSLEGSTSAELLQQVGAAFADVDELLTGMARIRAAGEDIDSHEIALSRGGVARLSYRAVAEDSAPRGHLWIFRAPSSASAGTENLP